MNNIDMKMEGKILVIRIDTSQRFGPSASGKTIAVCSTGGNVPVNGVDGMSLGINGYVPNPDFVKNGTNTTTTNRI